MPSPDLFSFKNGNKKSELNLLWSSLSFCRDSYFPFYLFCFILRVGGCLFIFCMDYFPWYRMQILEHIRPQKDEREWCWVVPGNKQPSFHKSLSWSLAQVPWNPAFMVGWRLYNSSEPAQVLGDLAEFPWSRRIKHKLSPFWLLCSEVSQMKAEGLCVLCHVHCHTFCWHIGFAVRCITTFAMVSKFRYTIVSILPKMLMHLMACR